jgi:hypothetical protein
VRNCNRLNIFSTLTNFPHYTKLEEKIKIILHGTYLFMSENQLCYLM